MWRLSAWWKQYRSGRSKGAAERLALMGYCNVKEFGGIIDWSYGFETGSFVRRYAV
ncbi:MAG: hypothetical protein IKL49_09420 [Lachnospiraceae bacterium]|nr:hypothetical protein [Lachnospiraceae bacterium]